MTHTITILDQTLQLLPQRALYWPSERILFVADLHLGKPDAFLQAGIPVPTEGTRRDLERLSNLLTQTGAERLVILGDFLHARASHSPGVADALLAWRSTCTGADVLLVNGNHDLHAGPPPKALGFTICDEATVGPFYCVHVPLEEDESLPGGAYGLSGHLHPYGVVSGRTRESLRLPCFYLTARQMVLPAFGHFTGGFTVSPKKNECVYVIAGDTVLAPRPLHREWVR